MGTQRELPTRAACRTMSTGTPNPRSADPQRVFAEQLGLVYELGVVGALAVVVVAWLYVLVVWGAVPHGELVVWATAFTLLSAVRIGAARLRRGPGDGTQVRQWKWGLLTLATLTGLMWAVAGTRLFPHDHLQMQLIAVIILVGMPAGAVASFGPYARSYACYLIAAMLPFAAGMFLRGGESAGWVLLASLIFVLYLMRVALWLEKTLRDNISQRLELERMANDLAHARDIAEAADRAKSNILASISKEVRSPLNAMRDMNDQLLVTPLNPAQRNQLRSVQQASRSLLDMLDTALDLSRIESGRLDVREEQFDPHAVLARVGHMYRPVALRKQLAFNVSIAPDTPHAVLGDPVRWLQVVCILVDNALKFTAEGEVAVEVEASVSGNGSGSTCVLRTEVSDTGVGLAPEERYHLFRRLTQVSGAAGSVGVAGNSGLAIATELAKLMGGDVGVTSEQGEGSRFWFNARLRLASEENK